MARVKEIPFNMETHSVKEWAIKLGMDEAVLGRRLRNGESMFNIVRNPRIYKKKNIKKCIATSIDECFTCRFTDCIRSRPIGGEATIIAKVLGEEYKEVRR